MTIDTQRLRELAKMTPEQNTDYERLKQAAASVWFAGNMYIGPSMAQLMQFLAEYKRLSPEYEQPAIVPDWLETTQFLTDVTTAAGLLEHGRRDKGLAQRIGDFAYKYRMLAVAPAAPMQSASVPVLTVECEPDYWSGGHYHEGTKPYIAPTAVWKLPIGTELYTSPPANNQSEQHLEMVNAPALSVPELEEYDAGALNDFGGGNVGWWQDYIRSELGRAYEFYCGQLSAAPTPAPSVPDSDLVIDLKHASYDALTAAARRSKWIPPEYVSNDWIADCINFLENGHPAVPADMVRDAERWLSQRDLELLVTFGMQADDCDADGHTLSREQTRRLCELGVLRNVGFGRSEMTAFGCVLFDQHWEQSRSLPLRTHAEYAALAAEKGGAA